MAFHLIAVPSILLNTRPMQLKERSFRKIHEYYKEDISEVACWLPKLTFGPNQPVLQVPYDQYDAIPRTF
jgi:hypothetical protein